MSARHRGRKRRTASESLCPQDQTGSLYPTTSHRLDDILPHERKSRQLCEQVAESLSLALATCDDPELLDCHVLEVEPWPGPGRLRVTVALDREVDPESLLAALSRAAPHLRREIAGDIHRKRVPTLVFTLGLPEEER